MNPASSGPLWSLRDDLNRLGYSSRMSPDSSPRIRDGTSESFSGHWPTSATGGPTGFWTLSTSVYPNDVAASTLSDILERQCPPRFYLSPQACLGILRRAVVRGRDLPGPLLRALVTTAIQAPGVTEAIPLYPVEVIRYLPKGTAASTTPLKPMSSTRDKIPSTPSTSPFPLMLDIPSTLPLTRAEAQEPPQDTLSATPSMQAKNAISETPGTLCSACHQQRDQDCEDSQDQNAPGPASAGSSAGDMQPLKVMERVPSSIESFCPKPTPRVCRTRSRLAERRPAEVAPACRFPRRPAPIDRPRR